MENYNHISNKTCRTCAENFTKKLSPLFKKENALIMHFVHSKEYNIKISKNDGLPQNICSGCLQELTRLHNFLMKCKKSEEILLKKYKTLAAFGAVSDYKDEYDLKTEYISDNEDSKECYFNTDNKENNCSTSIKSQLDITNLGKIDLEIKEKHHDIIDNDRVEKTSSRETSVELDNTDIKSDIEEDEDEALQNSGDKVCDNEELTKRKTRSCSKTLNTEKDKYICLPCDEVFENLSEYKRHRKIHPKSRKYVRETYLCDLCGKEFAKQETLRDHKNTHLGVKPYKCEICEKTFAVKNALRIHVVKHSKRETFTCETCGRVYTTKSYYREHLLRHEKGSLLENNEKPFKCPHCPRSFKLLSTLTAHCNYHNKTADRKYHCTECNTTFKRSDHLKEHINGVHLKILPFKCDICSKSFVTGAIRNAHVRRSHSGLRYKCNICEKDFSLSTSLSRHKRRHNGDKRFICEICNMSFMAVYQIEKHMETHKIDETTKNSLISKTYEEIAKAVTDTI
ncbi:zinc finger protein 479-like [Condylostylus longicornis]|uniref:zinc finger protein 479-like n=1 Tax=Condylostylus longicornis TaxID=2530218 RepID=UPI00244DE15F|nr:zinc finger protein 479-like [Condylostylus longicornis]